MENNFISKSKKVLTIGIMVAIVIISSFILFFIYYIPYLQDVGKIYENYQITTIITVIIALRIAFSIYASYFFVKKWIRSRLTSWLSIPFIFSWIFIFIILAKVFDYIMYIVYELNFYLGYPDTFILEVTRFRFLVIIVNILPLFLLGMFLYLYKRNMYKSKNGDIRVSSFKLVIFSTLYIILFSFMIFLVKEMNFFSIVASLLTVISFIPVIYFFYNAHKKGGLQDINPLLISIGFFLYIVSLIIFPILVNLTIPDVHEGEIFSVLFLEIATFVTTIIFFAGFL
jgi:hypothetical protein